MSSRALGARDRSSRRDDSNLARHGSAGAASTKASKSRRDDRDVPSASSAPSALNNVFRALALAGEKLADPHVNYEKQPDATNVAPAPPPAGPGFVAPDSSPAGPLTWLENPQGKVDYRVSKMRLGKDKSSLFYDDYWTLTNIPAEVYEYRLGSRDDDPEYIKRLIGQVIYVSLETVKTVKALPELVIAGAAKAEAAIQ